MHVLGKLMNVAAIDCGTNSIRLLVASANDDGSLTDLHREAVVVRLGQGVDETRTFHPDALARTFEVTKAFAQTIQSHQVKQVRFGATSAARDVTNREEFLDGIDRILGVRPDVITGQEEAELSFRGAARVVGEGTAMIVDLGGGSTELVIGRVLPGGKTEVVAMISIDLGSVRLTERYLHSDPPTAAEIDQATHVIRAELHEAAKELDLSEVNLLAGAAGTITTVTAGALGLDRYQPSTVNGTELTPEQIYQACNDLLYKTKHERGQLGFLQPGRIDVIGAGALLWREIVSWVEHNTRDLPGVLTSEHDILDGLALSLLT